MQAEQLVTCLGVLAATAVALHSAAWGWVGGFLVCDNVEELEWNE